MPPRSRSRSPGGSGQSREVEAFLRASAVEERAATQLRASSADVQRSVLRRGALAGTRDPTAVLISRIRNAEEGLKPVMDADKASEVVERFLAAECVEPHAAARLRKTSKKVQDSVVSRGSLSGTRDPTAVLMSRIRDAEKEMPPEVASTPGGAQGQAGSAADGTPQDLFSQVAKQWGEDYAKAYFAQFYQYQQLELAYASPQAYAALVAAQQGYQYPAPPQPGAAQDGGYAAAVAAIAAAQASYLQPQYGYHLALADSASGALTPAPVATLASAPGAAALGGCACLYPGYAAALGQLAAVSSASAVAPAPADTTAPDGARAEAPGAVLSAISSDACGGVYPLALQGAACGGFPLGCCPQALGLQTQPGTSGDALRFPAMQALPGLVGGASAYPFQQVAAPGVGSTSG
eukprot:TRINITY_DN34511_c0_g1_i1.p1 TRINITY_DN34511_c0_g1~~TRINITY_DN34511_c0_g1_i1.p1  ORF type:complete len:408 (-),score=62.88 TRINITY_DN34511_c0_g1_i1:227-1450(-)